MGNILILHMRMICILIGVGLHRCMNLSKFCKYTLQACAFHWMEIFHQKKKNANIELLLRIRIPKYLGDSGWTDNCNLL